MARSWYPMPTESCSRSSCVPGSAHTAGQRTSTVATATSATTAKARPSGFSAAAAESSGSRLRIARTAAHTTISNAPGAKASPEIFVSGEQTSRKPASTASQRWCRNRSSTLGTPRTSPRARRPLRPNSEVSSSVWITDPWATQNGSVARSSPATSPARGEAAQRRDEPDDQADEERGRDGDGELGRREARAALVEGRSPLDHAHIAADPPHQAADAAQPHRRHAGHRGERPAEQVGRAGDRGL